MTEHEPAPGKWPRVVIADDNQDALQALLWLVELTCPEAEVRTAQDGRRALELLEEFQPDLLVTDLRMPRFDGLSLCRRVQGDPELSDRVRILAVSGYDSAEVREALGRGPIEFVSKPLD